MADYDWRTIVVGGKGVWNRLLAPRIYKSDKKGDRIFTKTGEPQTDYATPEEAITQQVVDFATRQDDLKRAEPVVRDTINEVKTLLRSCKFRAVVYHAKGDPCSLMDWNHFHLIVGRERGVEWEKDYRWRKIRAACRTGSDPKSLINVTSQKVKFMEGLVRYLATPPRVWMGTNCQDIAVIRNNALTGEQKKHMFSPQDVSDDENFDGFLGVTGDDENNNPWGPPDLITSGDFAEEPSRKRSAKEWDEGTSAGLFVDPQEPATKKHSGWGDDHGKEGKIPRLINVIYYIMKLLGTSDRDELRRKAERSAKEGNLRAANWIARIKNAEYSVKNAHIWTTAANEYKRFIMDCPLGKLLLMSWHSLTAERPEKVDQCKFLSLDSSINLWFDWIAFHQLKPTEFLRDILTVLSGDGGKKNCLFLWGATNSGKSVMFSKPLEYIMQSVGRINQISAGNAFTFEACVNRRLISIEECKMAKIHIDELKKIMGGETCQVNVKGVREGGIVRSTPVIATSNENPLESTTADTRAIGNRCYLYHLQSSCPLLEDYINTALDPRLYVILFHIMKEYNGTIERIFDACEYERLCEELDMLSYPGDYEDGRMYSYYSMDPVPNDSFHEIPGTAIIGYYDSLPVVNPMYLTPTQLAWFFPLDPCTCKLKKYCKCDKTPLFTAHQLAQRWGAAFVLGGHYKVFARYVNCWLGTHALNCVEWDSNDQCPACNFSAEFHEDIWGPPDTAQQPVDRFQREQPIRGLEAMASWPTNIELRKSTSENPFSARASCEDDQGLLQEIRNLYVERYWEDPSTRDILMSNDSPWLYADRDLIVVAPTPLNSTISHNPNRYGYDLTTGERIDYNEDKELYLYKM